MRRYVPSGLAAALAATLATGCGPAEDAADRASRPIIGGTDSKEGQFPTVVGLLLDAYGPDPKGGFPLKCVRGAGVCTGTLIREDVILTAAHCVTNLLKGNPLIECPNDPEPPKYTFSPNLIAEARAGRVVATQKVVTHPKFAPTQCVDPPDVAEWNDIALVFLEKPMKDAKVQRLPTPAEAQAILREGDRVRIVGYGKSQVDDPMGMTAGLQRHGLATLDRVGKSELRVARKGEQQACQGDSGGPVMANPDGPPEQQFQIGVASRLSTPRCPSIWDLFNPPKCENGVFYTRVDAYATWIQETIEKERPTPPKPMDPPPEEPKDPPDMATGEPMNPEEPKLPEESGCACSTARGRDGGTPLLPLLLLGLLGLRRRAPRHRA